MTNFDTSGDLNKDDLEALKKKFNLEHYKEHYIDLKMNLSNCCEYAVKDNTDICSKCSEHCEAELLPNVIIDI